MYISLLYPSTTDCSCKYLPGLPEPGFEAIRARAVVVKGRLGDTDRTRSARTASLKDVLKIEFEALWKGASQRFVTKKINREPQRKGWLER